MHYNIIFRQLQQMQQQKASSQYGAHQKSSSQLPPNMSNAMRGQKYTIHKNNLLRQIQRQQDPEKPEGQRVNPRSSAKKGSKNKINNYQRIGTMKGPDQQLQPKYSTGPHDGSKQQLTQAQIQFQELAKLQNNGSLNQPFSSDKSSLLQASGYANQAPPYVPKSPSSEYKGSHSQAAQQALLKKSRKDFHFDAADGIETGKTISREGNLNDRMGDQTNLSSYAMNPYLQVSQGIPRRGAYNKDQKSYSEFLQATQPANMMTDKEFMSTLLNGVGAVPTLQIQQFEQELLMNSKMAQHNSQQQQKEKQQSRSKAVSRPVRIQENASDHDPALMHKNHSKKSEMTQKEDRSEGTFKTHQRFSQTLNQETIQKFTSFNRGDTNLQQSRSKVLNDDQRDQFEEQKGLELSGLIANAANAEQSLKASKVYLQQLERSNQNSKFSQHSVGMAHSALVTNGQRDKTEERLKQKLGLSLEFQSRENKTFQIKKEIKSHFQPINFQVIQNPTQPESLVLSPDRRDSAKKSDLTRGAEDVVKQEDELSKVSKTLQVKNNACLSQPRHRESLSRPSDQDKPAYQKTLNDYQSLPQASVVNIGKSKPKQTFQALMEDRQRNFSPEVVHERIDSQGDFLVSNPSEVRHPKRMVPQNMTPQTEKLKANPHNFKTPQQKILGGKASYQQTAEPIGLPSSRFKEMDQNRQSQPYMAGTGNPPSIPQSGTLRREPKAPNTNEKIIFPMIQLNPPQLSLQLQNGGVQQQRLQDSDYSAVKQKMGFKKDTPVKIDHKLKQGQQYQIQNQQNLMWKSEDFQQPATGMGNHLAGVQAHLGAQPQTQMGTQMSLGINMSQESHTSKKQQIIQNQERIKAAWNQKRLSNLKVIQPPQERQLDSGEHEIKNVSGKPHPQIYQQPASNRQSKMQLVYEQQYRRNQVNFNNDPNKISVSPQNMRHTNSGGGISHSQSQELIRDQQVVDRVVASNDLSSQVFPQQEGARQKSQEGKKPNGGQWVPQPGKGLPSPNLQGPSQSTKPLALETLQQQTPQEQNMFEQQRSKPYQQPAAKLQTPSPNISGPHSKPLASPQQQVPPQQKMFIPFEPQRDKRANDLANNQNTEELMNLLSVFSQQTRQQVSPQYHLDQSMIQADLIKKAASLFLPSGVGDQAQQAAKPVQQIQNKISGLEMLKQWQALYGNPSKQASNQRFRQQRSQYEMGMGDRSMLDNFNGQQLAYIRYLIEQQEGNILKQFQELIQNYQLHEHLQKLQQQNIGYTINQRQMTNYQARQRMIDFYKSIRSEDINDQAKLRSEAIAAAPPSNPHKLRFSVATGNNSRLIRNAMLKRSLFWEETTNSDPHFHFRWQPISNGIKFDQVGKEIDPEFHPCMKQIVNHFEGHSSLSEKSKLFSTMMHYTSEKLNENVFDFLPLTFFVEADMSKHKQYSKSMVQFMNAFYALDDIKKRTKKYFNKIDGVVEDDKIKPEEEEEQPVFKEAKEGKETVLDDTYIFKHFYQNKIGMIKQHKREEKEEKEAYQEAHQQNAKIRLHQKQAKASGADSDELAKYRMNQNKVLKKFFFRQTMPFCHFSGYNMWILKATKLNQGQGIHVCNSLPQVKQLIQKYCEGIPKKETEPLSQDKKQKQSKQTTVQLQTPGSDKSAKKQQLQSKSVKRSSRKDNNKLISNSSMRKINDYQSSELSDSSDQRERLPIQSPKGNDMSPGQGKSAQKKARLYSSPQQSSLRSGARNEHAQALDSFETINENDLENQSDFDQQKGKTSGTKSNQIGRNKHSHVSPRRQMSVKSEEGQRVTSNPRGEQISPNKNPLGEPKYKHNSFIIQKYIERPLLINQRKFDIRVWIFIDSEGDAYFCKKGYLRTSSNKFILDPDDPDNRFVHLTNVAIQKHSETFGQHEDGNILSFVQFQKYIDTNYPGRGYSIQDDLVGSIIQQISRTLFASRKVMDPMKRASQPNANFFELFGYDFMVDEDFNVWLIEVNTNPSLSESALYLRSLIPRMIDDMVKLTVDRLFLPFYQKLVHQRVRTSEELEAMLNLQSCPLKEMGESENIWEKLFNLHNRQSRKEGKEKWLRPIKINSSYAFNIKNRDFKIKKYLQHN